jgi:hypothetical protein
MYTHNAHPASPLQLYFLSLPAYSIPAAIMYDVYSCIIYNKPKNQKEWHVATKRLTFIKGTIFKSFQTKVLGGENLGFN